MLGVHACELAQKRSGMPLSCRCFRAQASTDFLYPSPICDIKTEHVVRPTFETRTPRSARSKPFRRDRSHLERVSQRGRDADDRRKRRIAAVAQRLVQALATKARTLRNSRHSSGPRHRSEGRYHGLSVAFSQRGIEVRQLRLIVGKKFRGIEGNSAYGFRASGSVHCLESNCSIICRARRMSRACDALSPPTSRMINSSPRCM